jgi:Ni,Fe-hydrogenase I large subunit
VTLDVADGRVASAQVSSSLYRGFEHILLAKHPLDALVIVPRICGICSVSQSAAAAAALADAAGLEMPANGRLASNLILACENLADHLTHFYLFFMPDFARAAYRIAPGMRRPKGVSRPRSAKRCARCCRRAPTCCA